MSLLLDTHLLIWSQLAAEKIGRNTLRRLMDVSSELFASTYSVFEISQLVYKGRLRLEKETNLWVAETLALLNCSVIELSQEIAIGAYQLPGEFHRDPADRALVATARAMGLTLVTADKRLLRYRKVKTLDARK